MSDLHLPGLFSGIDTDTLISQLLAIESRTMNLYQQQLSQWQDKKDALGTLESDLSKLLSSISALSNAQQLRSFGVASSDADIVTAQATNDAFEGNHNVVINRLATADRWVHTAGFEYPEDYVGAGTFIYSYNGKETVITTTDTTTLEGLVGLINNDADNPGVTASLLHYANSYHLVLNGNDAGGDYQISINSGSTEVWQADTAFTRNSDNAALSTRITQLDQFGDNPLEGGEVIEITGTDRYGNPINQVNLELTANTKLSHLIDKINQAFDGNVKATLENGKIVVTDAFSGDSDLSINLTYNANGSAATLSLPTIGVLTEGGSTPATLNGFGLADFTRTQAAQDSKIKIDGYPSQDAVSEVQQIEHTTAVTSGTFTLGYGGFTTDAIAYDADAATIQAALEALPNVNAGDITVSGDALNTSGTLTFTFNDTLGDVNMMLIDSSGLSETLGVTEQTKGVDEYISRSSNTIDDVIYGLSLDLHDVTDESGESITLTRNTESVKQKLLSMIDAYNSLMTNIKEKTGYNDVSKTAGILMGDYVVSTIKTQLSMPLIRQTSGFVQDVDSFLTPGQIGLQLGSDGMLSLDTNAFDKAIAGDYTGVLAIIGAAKTGSSDSNTIRFYQASSSYTTAGNYNVEVTVSGGAITSARMKLSSESTWNDATYSGNVVTGESSFDDNGNPVNPENGLLLSVDLSQDGTYTATVRVKQGFAGAIEDALDRMLKASTGSIDIDQKHIEDSIKLLQDRIDAEQNRVDQKKEQLIEQFARLEKTLALLQNQMAGLGLSSSS